MINHVFLIMGLSVILNPTHPNYFAILIMYLQYVLVTMDIASIVFHRAGTIQQTELKFQQLIVKMVVTAILKMGKIAYKTMV
jgi:hypothetical protein